MAEISFGGLATGLPTEELVSSLMAIERRPLDRLQAEKEYESRRLAAYSQFAERLEALRAAAGELSSAVDGHSTSARLSSEGTICVSCGGASVVGSHDIAVVQLAQVQKNVIGGFSSDTDNLLGTGTFLINDTIIEIDATNNSLQGVRDAINGLAGETGVYASIINDGRDSDGYHLVLSGKDASAGFSLKSSFRDSEGNPIPFSDTLVREAQQAIAYIDGIEVVSSSNTLANVIAGLTVTLNNESEILSPAEEGKPPVYDATTLSIETDPAWLKEKLAAFVSSYNELMKLISSGYPEGKAGDGEEGTPLGGLLHNDAAIYDVKRHLQAILADAVTGGSLRILSEAGIATQRDGGLLVDDKKLESVLQTKFEDVVKLLAGDGSATGVMRRFNDYLVGATSPTTGIYASKRDRYETAVHRLNRQIAQKEPLMAKIEERIRAQFNAMELLVNNLNAQSDYFSQQINLLANLPTGKTI